MSWGAGRRIATLALLLGSLVPACASSSRTGHELVGGDPTDRWSIPMSVGKPMTYGALVLHAKARPVRLVSATLLPFPDRSYPDLHVKTRAVGPERLGKVLGIGDNKVRDSTVGPGVPLREATVKRSTQGIDWGTEVLFQLTPPRPGMYWFRAARVTYIANGQQETQEFPAYLLLCVGKLQSPCGSQVLSDAIAKQGV